MHIYVHIYVHTYVDIDTYTEILIFSPSLEQKWGGLYSGLHLGWLLTFRHKVNLGFLDY